MYRESTIPKNAKRVFKGQIFDVYQWEQEMFDGSKAIFEKLKRPDTAVILAVTEDKKIIVQEETQPHTGKFITLPGGRVDAGEDIVEAAKRELLEETGYASGSYDLYLENAPYVKMDWVIYHFIARGCKKVNEPKQDAGERAIVKLLTFQDFLAAIDSAQSRDTHLKNHLNELRLIPGGVESLQKALGL